MGTNTSRLFYEKGKPDCRERLGIKCPVVLRTGIKDMLCIGVIWL